MIINYALLKWTSEWKTILQNFPWHVHLNAEQNGLIHKERNICPLLGCQHNLFTPWAGLVAGREELDRIQTLLQNNKL